MVSVAIQEKVPRDHRHGNGWRQLGHRPGQSTRSTTHRDLCRWKRRGAPSSAAPASAFPTRVAALPRAAASADLPPPRVGAASESPPPGAPAKTRRPPRWGASSPPRGCGAHPVLERSSSAHGRHLRAFPAATCCLAGPRPPRGEGLLPLPCVCVCGGGQMKPALVLGRAPLSEARPATERARHLLLRGRTPGLLARHACSERGPSGLLRALWGGACSSPTVLRAGLTGIHHAPQSHLRPGGAPSGAAQSPQSLFQRGQARVGRLSGAGNRPPLTGEDQPSKTCRASVFKGTPCPCTASAPPAVVLQSESGPCGWCLGPYCRVSGTSSLLEGCWGGG